MVQFLRQLAVGRGERQDFTQGWYDASYLIGSEWIAQYTEDANDPPLVRACEQ